MHHKQTALLLSLLLLTACAATGPTASTGPRDAGVADCPKEESALKEEIETTQTVDTAAMTDTQAGAETTAPPLASEMEVLTLPQLLYRLDRVTTLESKEKTARIQEMENRLKALSPADRYEFALLLSHKGKGNKMLKRVIFLLEGLETYAKDQIVLEIIRLHRRCFELQMQYAEERSKTIELNKKIERLKGLEQDLDKSNTRIQESLKSTPGEMQQP